MIIRSILTYLLQVISSSLFLFLIVMITSKSNYIFKLILNNTDIMNNNDVVAILYMTVPSITSSDLEIGEP